MILWIQNVVYWSPTPRKPRYRHQNFPSSAILCEAISKLVTHPIMLAAILDFTILKLFQSCLPRSIGIAEPENIGIDVNIVHLGEFNDKL